MVQWLPEARWPTAINGQVFILAAFDRVGRAMFGSEWTGREGWAEMPTPVFMPLDGFGFAGEKVRDSMRRLVDDRKVWRARTVSSSIFPGYNGTRPAVSRNPRQQRRREMPQQDFDRLLRRLGEIAAARSREEWDAHVAHLSAQHDWAGTAAAIERRSMARKGIIDQAMDTAAESAGPKFKAARAAHREWAKAFDDPDGVAKLIARRADGSFVNADNWRQAENNLTGGLSDRAHAQITTQLGAIGATEPLNRLRAATLQKAYGAASKGDQDAGGNAVASGAKWFETLNGVGMPKLRALFSPEELADIASTGRAATHLNSKVPGTNNTSNTSSAIVSSDLGRRMIKGIHGGGGTASGNTTAFAGGGLLGVAASLMGHTTLGPAIGAAVPVAKLTTDALRRRSASKALAAGLKDAGNPAVARVEAALRKAHEARVAAVRSAAPQIGRSASASHDGRRLATGLRRHLATLAAPAAN